MFTVPGERRIRGAAARCRARSPARYSPDGAQLRLRRDLDGVHSRVVRDEHVAPLSRRPHASDQHHGPGDERRREAAVAEQQRQRPDVGRQHRVLPLRPQLHAQSVLVQPRDEEARAADAPRRRRHHDGVRRIRRDRLRAERRHPPLRHQDGPIQSARDRRRRRLPVGAAAVQARREHDPRREPLAHRRARGVRGARRHLHGSGRQGRLAQPDEVAGRARSKPGVVPRRRAARVALRREGRRPAHDRRPVGPQHAARDSAPRLGLFLGARVVAERKAAARRRQSSESVDRRRRDGQGDEARRGRVQHAGPELPGDVVAGLAMGRVHEEPRQPHARRLRALARRAAIAATHRRARRRHVAELRRERQVPLLPRQHRLRSAVRLGRDERRRSPVAALGVSRGAQRERAVAASARDG